MILWSLAETLDSRPPRVGHRARIGVVVVDEGTPPLSVTLAVGERPLITRGAREDCDLMIATNAVTLSDLVRGKFDPNAPGPDHLFLYAGSVELIGELAAGLDRTKSWLDVQAGRGAR